MSLDAPVMPQGSLAPLSYLDVLLVVVAAPIMLLIGVSGLGYGIGAGAWLLLRAIGLAVEHAASTSVQPRAEIALRMVYMLGRLFGLALAVILARMGGSKNDGLTALVVIVVAFTVQLATSALTRPRGARR